MNRPFRRRTTRLAAAIAVMGATALVVAHANPASAYTVEQPNSNTIVLTSDRLDDDTVHATIRVHLYRDGTTSWTVDARNGGAKRKFFDIWCNVHFNTIFDEFRVGPDSRLAIQARRKDGGTNTYYGVSSRPIPSLKDHFDDLLPVFPADCHLRHRRTFENIPPPSDG